DGSAGGVDQVHGIRPVATVPLHDVELVPKHRLGRQYLDPAAFELDLRTRHPELIDLGAVIGHGPNHVDDGIVGGSPINPPAVVGDLFVIIGKAKPGQHANHALLIFGEHVQIQILGTPPGSRVSGDREGAAQSKWYTLPLRGSDYAPVDSPLIGGYQR